MRGEGGYNITYVFDLRVLGLQPGLLGRHQRYQVRVVGGAGQPGLCITVQYREGETKKYPYLFYICLTDQINILYIHTILLFEMFDTAKCLEVYLVPRIFFNNGSLNTC